MTHENSNYWDRINSGRVSRRRALQMAALTGAAASAIAVVGCGGDDDDDGGKTPGAGATPVSEGKPKIGGTFRGTVSLVLGKDPHKASTFLTHALASYSYNRLLRFKTVLGEIRFDDKGDVVGPTYVFYKWHAGTYAQQ